ncbi:ATP phosphoribosyltransferase [Candidatus Sumerlaeota bacterium]|nr:ATP phosphoribosyltransferase [Candidatus Sumerlaeota bacterium]
MIKIALPKGDIQEAVGIFLADRGIRFDAYTKDARAYASRAGGEQSLFSKQFREKDIPIQVSIGNYDLGLCGAQWIAEYMGQYPRADILNLRTLNISEGEMCVCCSSCEPDGNTGDDLLRTMSERGPIRIATPFPILAEEYALKKRLPDFRIFPLWGAAEAYPPEGAELILICVDKETILEENNLRIVERLFPAMASLIANKVYFEKKDLSEALEKLI